MSINISAPQLEDPLLTEHIEHCLKTYEVNPNALIFEIKEGAFNSKSEKENDA